MNSITQLADATAAELNSETLHEALEALGLPHEWTARRLNDPEQALKDLKSLQVIVTPAAVERTREELGDRGGVGERHEISVAVMQGEIATGDPERPTVTNDRSDPLIQLCEALCRHLDDFEAELDDGGGIAVESAEYPVLYAPEWFRQLNLFGGFLKLTFVLVD